MAFNGSIDGNPNQIQDQLRQFSSTSSSKQTLTLGAIVDTEKGMNVNAAVLFDQPETLKENIRELQVALGLQSDALDEILTK